MEDVEITKTPPGDDLPEANHDPRDPLNPEIEEENNTPRPSAADPGQDEEVTGTNEVDRDVAPSDDEDDLSEIADDEMDQLEEEFDPSKITIEQREAIAIDDSNVGQLGVHKRKRADGEDGGERKRKKKEGRRDKPKKHRKRRDVDDDFEGGVEIDGKRSRKSKEVGERKEKSRARKVQEDDENDESLTPEQRRARALNRAMDAALKNPNARRRTKKDGIDLESMADAEIENMRRRMTEAAQADTNARTAGRPAIHKLKMLPEVVGLLNRNTLQNNIVDPDINLLEAVRFFLEPLNDGSLPAFQIQRELFSALQRLPINKDTLVASGIGKVTYFYTKSKFPEPSIKRIAQKLVAEWTRPILKRTDDYRKRELVEANYDPMRIPIRNSQGQIDPAKLEAAKRAKMLATPVLSNRARMEGGPSSYTIAPKSNVQQGTFVRAPGTGSDAVLRRMKAAQQGGRGGRR